MNRLDPWQVSLDGTTLIEASAGTGKTYTLTTLYLRMLVEHDLLPSQILVVTYTQAATAELRERLRSRIRDAIRAGDLADKDSESEEFDEELARLAHEARKRSSASGRPDALRRALQEFDEAAVFTIHGFCQRMLSQSAFESQVAFDAELIEASDLLIEGVARDLWARAIADEEPGFVAWLLRGEGRKRWQFNPEKLKREILDVLGADEEMPVWPSIEEVEERQEAAPSREQVLTTLRDWAIAWETGCERVSPWLLEGGALNKTSYKPETIDKVWLPALEELRRQIESEGDALDPASLEMPKFWEKLTAAGVANGVKKGFEALEDPIWEAFTRVHEALSALDRSFHVRALRLRCEFVAAARIEAKRRRDHDHRLLFDDLLSELRRALRPPAGTALAMRLREQFPFALIDEFQDTDPVQYEIFRGVWHRDADPAFVQGEAGTGDASGLVLIGDPKQAIYSFRGADLFTYLRARADAGDVYGLEVNWRSTPALVEVVNALFSRPKNGFGFEALQFDPISPSPDAASPLLVGGAPAPGLRVLLADRAQGLSQGEADDVADAKPEATTGKKKSGKQKPEDLPLRFGRTHVTAAVARDIADLLDAGAEIDGRPARPSDIAILCQTKRELARMRTALEALSIPCVDRGDANVFDSAEAWELLCVLRATQRPGDPRLIRAAFATSAGGVQSSSLRTWTESSDALTGASERFADYARLFKESGFARAFEHFRRREAVTARLLALVDGERRLTNWLHLAELLQTVSARRSLSVAGLANWLERAIADEASREEVGSDASLLRLERDDEAVSLITQHRSKGLEFEIVYLPSLWEGSSRRGPADASADEEKDGDERKTRPPVRFHDADTGARVLDLGSADYAVSRRREQQETWTEGLRLLYVALTRAKRQCVVAWGAIGTKYMKTPLAWLLAAAESGDEDLDPSVAAKSIRLFEDADWQRLWADVGEAAGANSVAVETAHFEPRARWRAVQGSTSELVFRGERRAVAGARETTSFSGLIRGSRFAIEESAPEVTGRDLDADVDSRLKALLPPDMEPTANLDAEMDQFPKGAYAGTLLHEVLEQIVFSQIDTARVEALALDALARNGLPSGHAPQVVHVVDSVAHVPLSETAGPVCLADLAPQQFLPEMEFTLDAGSRSATGGFSPWGLAEILRSADADSPLKRYADRAASLQWRTLRGFLRGFVDATFFDGQRYFLIDYKSNFLGSQQADYRADRLLTPMIEHDYVLQYLIYSVALDRHLERTLEGYDYEKHFGGAYYLFLRGLSRGHEEGCGVFFDRPEQQVIREIRALLEGQGDVPAQMSMLFPADAGSGAAP